MGDDIVNVYVSLAAHTKTVRAAFRAAGAPERMTLTVPGILASRRIVLLFMGQDKLNVFNEAKEGRGGSPIKDLLAQKKVPVHAFWAP